jgi:hypothetical protein
MVHALDGTNQATYETLSGQRLEGNLHAPEEGRSLFEGFAFQAGSKEEDYGACRDAVLHF